MLTLTHNAQSVIRDLTTQPELPDGSGLRIAPADADGRELQLSLQPEPVAGDQVIEAEDGVRVFLEPAAATLLADQTLDAKVSDGSSGFYLTAQNVPAQNA